MAHRDGLDALTLPQRLHQVDVLLACVQDSLLPMFRMGSTLPFMHCDGLCVSVRQRGPHTTPPAPCLQAILKSWPSAAWAG